MEFYAHRLGFWEPTVSSALTPSYPETGNALSYAIERDSHWFSARNRTLCWAISRFPFEGAFVDVGGGNGYQLLQLQASLFKERRLTAAMCEPGVEGCINAAQRGVHNIYHCGFDEFPAQRYTIGAIGLFDVLEHVELDSQFLRRILDRCPPKTRIFITVPALRSCWSRVDNYSGHFRRYDRKEFRRLVEETALKPVFCSYFFSYYTPFVWAFRTLAERVRPAFSDEEITEREVRFHRGGLTVMNFALRALHALELSLLKAGFRLPFGTSMLMVLEKR